MKKLSEGERSDERLDKGLDESLMKSFDTNT